MARGVGGAGIHFRQPRSAAHSDPWRAAFRRVVSWMRTSLRRGKITLLHILRLVELTEDATAFCPAVRLVSLRLRFRARTRLAGRFFMVPPRVSADRPSVADPDRARQTGATSSLAFPGRVLGALMAPGHDAQPVRAASSRVREADLRPNLIHTSGVWPSRWARPACGPGFMPQRLLKAWNGSLTPAASGFAGGRRYAGVAVDHASQFRIARAVGPLPGVLARPDPPPVLRPDRCGQNGQGISGHRRHGLWDRRTILPDPRPAGPPRRAEGRQPAEVLRPSGAEDGGVTVGTVLRMSGAAGSSAPCPWCCAAVR